MADIAGPPAAPPGESKQKPNQPRSRNRRNGRGGPRNQQQTARPHSDEKPHQQSEPIHNDQGNAVDLGQDSKAHAADSQPALKEPIATEHPVDPLVDATTTASSKKSQRSPRRKKAKESKETSPHPSSTGPEPNAEAGPKPEQDAPIEIDLSTFRGGDTTTDWASAVNEEADRANEKPKKSHRAKRTQESRHGNSVVDAKAQVEPEIALQANPGPSAVAEVASDDTHVKEETKEPEEELRTSAIAPTQEVVNITSNETVTSPPEIPTRSEIDIGVPVEDGIEPANVPSDALVDDSTLLGSPFQNGQVVRATAPSSDAGVLTLQVLTAQRQGARLPIEEFDGYDVSEYLKRIDIELDYYQVPAEQRAALLVQHTARPLRNLVQALASGQSWEDFRLKLLQRFEADDTKNPGFASRRLAELELQRPVDAVETYDWLHEHRSLTRALSGEGSWTSDEHSRSLVNSMPSDLLLQIGFTTFEGFYALEYGLLWDKLLRAVEPRFLLATRRRTISEKQAAMFESAPKAVSSEFLVSRLEDLCSTMKTLAQSVEGMENRLRNVESKSSN